MENRDQEFLAHFGKKGMRWGHRNKRALININIGSHDHSSDDHKNTEALKKKKISEMSNAELKAFNSRLQMEKQYKELTKKEISPGKKVVQEILGNAAKQTATSYAAKFMTQAVESALKKKI